MISTRPPYISLPHTLCMYSPTLPLQLRKEYLPYGQRQSVLDLMAQRAAAAAKQTAKWTAKRVGLHSIHT